MARGSGSRDRWGSGCAGSRSWTWPEAVSRWPTRMGRCGSSTTAKSTTTPTSGPSSSSAAIAIGPEATPRRSCTCTRRTGSAASSGSRGCSRLRCGTRSAGGYCWPAIGWASSRSTTPGPTMSSSSRRRSRRFSLEAPFARRSTSRSFPSSWRRDSSPGRRPSSAGCASFCRGGPSHGHAPRGPGNAATGGCLPLPTARPGRSRPAGARCVPGSRRLSGATS